MKTAQTFEFTNFQPSVFDGLGEISWRALLKCEVCGPLTTEQLNRITNWYDGCLWEQAFCPHCGNAILGLPDSPSERAVLIEKHPELGTLEAQIFGEPK